MAKLDDTAETTIAITFLVMNLELLLKQFFARFFFLLPQVFLYESVNIGSHQEKKIIS